MDNKKTYTISEKIEYWQRQKEKLGIALCDALLAKDKIITKHKQDYAFARQRIEKLHMQLADQAGHEADNGRTTIAEND